MGIRRVEKIDNLVKVKHVIMSVSDKTGLQEFVKGLIELNPDVIIYSTGGTYKKIVEILGDDAAKNVKEVSEYIEQPETEGGLVKTLDFKLFLGYLTETYCDGHQNDLKRTGAVPMDLVVFNLYPFEQTAAKEGIDYEDVRGNIDVGGPSALRAAAKNWHRVATVVDPADYERILKEMKENNGCTRAETRIELCKKAWGMLHQYNKAIDEYHQKVSTEEAMKPYMIVNEGK